MFHRLAFIKKSFLFTKRGIINYIVEVLFYFEKTLANIRYCSTFAKVLVALSSFDKSAEKGIR